MQDVKLKQLRIEQKELGAEILKAKVKAKHQLKKWKTLDPTADQMRLYFAEQVIKDLDKALKTLNKALMP